MVSDNRIVMDWRELRSAGLAKAARLQRIKDEHGITKKRAEEAVKAAGEWYDSPPKHDPYVNRYDEAWQEEHERRSNRQFAIAMWSLVILVVGFLALLYGPEFFREANPFQHDGYYCTDTAGQNCYMDADSKQQ